ncbi:MAG TPA: hypothetical protein VGG29_13175 [Caulobacteraceae bacterium]|jgi:TonB family protein
MRAGVAVLILAGALVAGPQLAGAAPKPAAPPPAAGQLPAAPLPSAPLPGAAPRPRPLAMPQPQPDNTFLVFYPTAARAAGVEGEATLRCGRTEHLALVGCVLVSETPDGQGFGAAALNMAAQSKENPKLAVTDPKVLAPQPLTVRFTLRPPRISPDITAMSHAVAEPQIVTQPTKAQIQAAYPVRALSDQVQGGAVIDCLVSVGGGLEACRVGAESPAGYGFGQAAVDLAGDFKMKPGELDGDPVGGRPVRISVGFTTADPTAPLTLPNR